MKFQIGSPFLARFCGKCATTLIGCKTGAARGLLISRHLGVKITDFTDFHPILIVFQ